MKIPRAMAMPGNEEDRIESRMSGNSEEKLKLRLAECGISQELFSQMCSVLNISRKSVLFLIENSVGFKEFQFMRDSISFLGENGYSTEKKIDMVHEILRNLEIELNEVRDYNLKPENINVWPNAEDFHDQLMESQRLDERAREIEERLALPDEERIRIEEEMADEIRKDISLWSAILHSLENENQPPEEDPKDK